MKRFQQLSILLFLAPMLLCMAMAFSATNHHKKKTSTSRTTTTMTSTTITTPRRNILTTMVSTILPTIGSVLITKPETSVAKDELFKSNPLTNPILEQIRILEQAEADNIQYGGELAPGSPKGREAYANLLVPILEMQSDLVQVERLLFQQQDDNIAAMKLEAANKILSKPQFEKNNLKRHLMPLRIIYITAILIVPMHTWEVVRYQGMNRA
jgi:hypothetical protein